MKFLRSAAAAHQPRGLSSFCSSQKKRGRILIGGQKFRQDSSAFLFTTPMMEKQKTQYPKNVFSTKAAPSPSSAQSFDTETIYKHKTSCELFSAYSILRACRIDSLTKLGPAILENADRLGVASPVYWGLKKTFFSHFCGGESVDDPQLHKNIARLNQMGIGAILDYSVEAHSGADSGASSSEAPYDRTVNVIAKTIELTAAKDKLNNYKSNGFSCVKMTALCHPELLLRMSQLIAHSPSATTTFELGIPSSFSSPPPSLAERPSPYVFSSVAKYSKYLPGMPGLPPTVVPLPQPLSREEQEQLKRLVARLDKLCSESSQRGVPFLIDAEQTYFQPAVDYLALEMMAKYNRGKCVVYNTYQLYLKDAESRFRIDADFARKGSWQHASKIVRGAYMNSERERIRRGKATDTTGSPALPDPFHPNIAETHRAYDATVTYILDNVADMATVVASHNKNSIACASAAMKQKNLVASSNPSCPPSSPMTPRERISFAQLYGMADYLTMDLANMGFRVCKYLPFGPIQEVMPYLTRRLEENKDMMGQAPFEVGLISKELTSRLFGRH